MEYDKEKTMHFNYRFEFTDRQPEEFAISIDKKSLEYRPPQQEAPPSWTELGFNTCPHCTLDSTSVSHCPLAVGIASIIDRFAALISYEKTFVTITSNERTYSCDTTVQRGLGSLLGLVIATSGCPYTKFLRPMAHFHLPDSTSDETIYRVVGMYFIGQFFRKNEGLDAALALDGLFDLYANVETVNSHIVKRVRAATSRDAPVNAIVVLDYLAKNMGFAIREHLEEIRPLWSAYTTEQAH